MHRQATLENLKKYRATIKPQWSDDEAAYEHMGEVDSVIDAINEGKSNAEVRAAAEYVGMQHHIEGLDEAKGEE